MYKLSEYSSNYYETAGNLWFYCKNEATNFSTDIASDDYFKLFKYKAKLLGNTEANGANGLSRNTKIIMPLKSLSNFYGSIEMSLINCEVELKLK